MQEQISIQKSIQKYQSVATALTDVTGFASDRSGSRDLEHDAVLAMALDRLASRQVQSLKGADAMGILNAGLTLHLRHDLLRGVGIHHVLQGFGRLFKSSASTDDAYNLSTQCDVIDDFISHDWATPWLTKAVALYYYYNHHVASVFSCLAAVVAAIAQANFRVGPFIEHELFHDDARGVGCWASWAGTVAYVLVLVFLQQWKARLVGTTHVFLDKLCINQADVDLKMECILAIGAFLKHSKTLVVLWSPRYFTRLWCTYELATWQHLGRCFESTVRFLPVAYTTMLAIGAFGQIVFLNIRVWSGDLRMYLYLLSVQSFGLSLTLAYFARRSLQDLKLVKPQLSAFSVKKAACYCCSNNHRDPVTGEILLCDRTLVVGLLLSRMAGGESEDVNDSLEKYDQVVRAELYSAMVEYLSFDMRYRDVLCTAVPSLWRGLDFFVAGRSTSVEDGARYLFIWTLLWLFIYPSILQFLVRLISLCIAETCNTSSTLRQVSIDLLCGAIGVLFGLCLWMPCALAAKARADAFLAAWPVVLLLVTVVTYGRSLRLCARRWCPSCCLFPESSRVTGAEVLRQISQEKFQAT
eukprot:TRINITY_DN9549_c0_g1_i2.p1 TRINITY_DN9549_c0_g1~~TRINITY_DN9549_c0_g1_i2.p1  ORF type:complete len:582 (+),score=50.95 TRINITY_DN9549_c0_g1_i2:208-1953(+)